MTAPSQRQERAEIVGRVEKIVAATPAFDIHTHLYDPAFGELLLWGIDDLLVYHYLVAEGFRVFEMPYEKFWTLSKTEQADLIWDALFLQNSPISEACRGVLTTLNALGLDVKKRDLNAIRKWFKQWTVADFVTRCMELGGVARVCMTNSPFDPVEESAWEKSFTRDERFVSALRIDPLLLDWEKTVPYLTQHGYRVEISINQQTSDEVRRFLSDWSKKIKARYLMVSLGPQFAFPSADLSSRLLEASVLPICEELGLPLALMLGVKRQVNPALRLAGDGVGLSDLTALQHLCAGFPKNKFLVTALARENQHELCVLARKFRNLHIFGCWWFTNIPQVMDEMSRMRLELIGPTFTAQHSDARVLDQLIYKWRHSRNIIGNVLTDKYQDLLQTGWNLTDAEIQRDVTNLLGGAFERFCAGPKL